MKIYTGIRSDRRLTEKINKYGMGIMISACESSIQKIKYAGNNFPFFSLDNGAFAAHTKGYPFSEYIFLKALSRCQEHNIKLDFIVVPDIVGGGKESLLFSARWLDRIYADNLALVVNNEIAPADVVPYLPRIKYIFISGKFCRDWQAWIGFAHDNGKLCHVGHCGTYDKLKFARGCGADSCDSTNFARNDNFDALDKYYDRSQRQLEFAY